MTLYHIDLNCQAVENMFEHLLAEMTHPSYAVGDSCLMDVITHSGTFSLHFVGEVCAGKFERRVYHEEELVFRIVRVAGRWDSIVKDNYLYLFEQLKGQHTTERFLSKYAEEWSIRNMIDLT